jgi:DNA-binding NtrC family response regulator
LHVTVVPFRDANGAFTGAVEILRPADPDPGFVACGRGSVSQSLRLEIARLARSDAHVLLFGDEAVCADVALAIHEASRLDRKLFRHWRGSWDGINPWPPGTVFGYGSATCEALDGGPGSSWRIIVGLPKGEGDTVELQAERLQIPEPTELDEDLPAVIAAWVDRLRPALKVAPAALERLSSIARSEGWSGLEAVLRTAVSAAGERLEDSNIPLGSFQTVVLDEVLRSEEPLAALEKRLLEEVLERSGWRMQDAADRLCMSRVTLWRKLKDHGIERPDNGDAES